MHAKIGKFWSVFLIFWLEKRLTPFSQSTSAAVGVSIELCAALQMTPAANDGQIEP